MKAWLSALARFFYPGTCGACEIPLDESERWICRRCRSRLVLAETDLKREVAVSDALDGVYSGYFYDEILQAAIHHFKYHRALSMARFFGVRLAEVMRTELGLARVDVIVPLPLHKIRRRDRGFNQAELIAQCLSQETKLRLEANCLYRIRNNDSQTKMHDAEGRIKNVSGIFRVNDPACISGKSVVLVDDLITTGATINEGARALKAAGATKVTALCVGRPLLEHSPIAQDSFKDRMLVG